MNLILNGTVAVKRKSDGAQVGFLTFAADRIIGHRRAPADHPWDEQLQLTTSSLEEALNWVEGNPHVKDVSLEQDVVRCGEAVLRKIADLPSGYFIGLPVEDRPTPHAFHPWRETHLGMPVIANEADFAVAIKNNAKSFTGSVHFSLADKIKITAKKSLREALSHVIEKAGECIGGSGHDRLVWKEGAKSIVDDIFERRVLDDIRK